ncbi:outer membrane protein assembly factor BamC [Methylobacter sp.]|uniref:outer membrane protein assembly factor BamC n=1 Tax=Methylobacter sp. TaxID=2051955 RepID=UPI001225D556|nr:outer membrane protein assembly factor BamC [Methylobacter sp.]TAK63286.1 MAG: outer membrane protein assembly factor BamC [Methylobacter sp.]
MKTKIRLLIIGAALVNVSACTYIKNLFPDKEKDYQFTTEIPPLVLPADLGGGSIAKAPAAETTNAPVSETPDAASAVTPTETAPAIDKKLIQVELLDSEQGAKQLRIGAPVAIAWRMVGKALSRNSIEVTNRNQEERLFHVQYDPNKNEVEDGSIWDEVVFFFVGFDISEQEYVLKLVESGQQTDVIIMDKDQKSATDRISLSLMTLLHDTIKADLAK